MDLILFLPVLLFSVVVHEVAHALVAKWEGDETAYRLGRITLNPIPHIDPVGSVIVPLILFLLPGNFLFGWAKPVPVNPANFRNYRGGDIRVSLAGIVANLGLAALSFLLLFLTLKVGSWMGGGGVVRGILVQLASFGLLINLILAFFNLIPLPPLDGSHVLYHLLPPALGARYREVGRYGLGILFLTVSFFPGVFDIVFLPVELLLDAAERLLRMWV